MRSRRLLFVLVIFCVSTAAHAQATKPSDTITRVYDVRDLLMSLPDFGFEGTIGMPEDSQARRNRTSGASLFGGTGGGGGGGQQPPEPKPRVQRVKDLTELVSETVQPETWRAAGGTQGSIRELDGQLVITHTPEAHTHIATVLSELRKSTGLVRIQADWIVLTPAQVSELIDPANTASPKLIDRAALAKLPSEAVHYRGEISCFNMQTVSVSSGRFRTVIYDGEPVVAQNAAALNPEVRQAQVGAMLEVAPMIVGSDAIVQVRSAVAEWAPPTKAEISYSSTQPGGSNVQGPSAIDRLDVLQQELKSVVRIPLDQPVLVGGMTLEPSVKDPQGSQLYLILQVSVSR